MGPLTYSESIVIENSPELLYDLVSDVTRTGEWSPICKACWWDEDDGPREGARFTGRNEIPGRTWETRSQVIVAQRGREFAWMVGDSFVRWGYTFAPVEGGTRLTESWEFRPEGLAMFKAKYGSDAETEIAARTKAAHDGIPVTLAAIKRVTDST